MEPAPRSLQDDLSDFNMKIMLLGDVGVGKTSLLRHESGVEGGEGAPGAIADSGGAAPNLLVKLYQVGGLTYQVTYWDAPGGSRYGDLTARYCLGAAATIIVFDVTRRATVRVLLSFRGNVFTRARHAVLLILGLASTCVGSQGSPIIGSRGRAQRAFGLGKCNPRDTVIRNRVDIHTHTTLTARTRTPSYTHTHTHKLTHKHTCTRTLSSLAPLVPNPRWQRRPCVRYSRT